MPGVPSPLANRKPGDIDFWVVRENTEGEYSSVGGRMFPDTEREFVTQQTVMTRIGVDRILKFAFDLAQSRAKKHLTSATKSNGISITMPYWDERVEAMAKKPAAAPIVSAIERTLGERTLRTKDLGGNADTSACGKAVAEMVE